jgi:hypothetical protein
MGTRKIAVNNEIANDITTVNARPAKSSPGISKRPLNITRGRNTQRVVSVDAVMATTISLVPMIDAVFSFAPLSRYL